jgi:predicted transcriptional regulator
MSETTTLKLPEKLKRRIAPLAKSADKTPHAWMLEALELQASLAERRRSFVADALDSEKQVRNSGKAYRAEDVHRYIRARASGRKPARPKPVNW